MIQYHDENVLVKISALEAIFADGWIMQEGNVTIKQDTPLGTELWIVGTSVLLDEAMPRDDDTNVPSDRIIRLIFITPERDWRRNETYAWKLDSAWMSNDEESSPYDCTWLHWNVQSYIDSAIQVPDDINLWECPEVEMHFRPIRDSSSLKSFPVTTNTRLLLRNVTFGLGKSLVMKNSISPCPGQASDCSVVDGEVRFDKRWNTWKIQGHNVAEDSLLGLALVTMLLLGLIGACIISWRRCHRTQLYEQLNSEEDLRLAVEDAQQST